MHFVPSLCLCLSVSLANLRSVLCAITVRVSKVYSVSITLSVCLSDWEVQLTLFLFSSVSG